MTFTESFATTAQAVVGLGADAAALAALPDDQLVAAHTLLTAHRRHADLYAAFLAGEISRRSSREAGYTGLAQRNGHGSAESFVQSLAPVSRAEATALIAAGELMATQPQTLWEAALSSGLSEGSLAVPAADAIRRGLQPVADAAPAADLLAECERLIARAPAVSLDELRKEARSARDRLDEAGIARREKQRRDNRYLKRWVRDDGMYQGAFLLDPEAGLQVFTALDAIMAPRRRVVFRDEVVDESPLPGDDRTGDQRLADALVDMVRVAVDADPGTLFGSKRPAVRVVVTEDTLQTPGGHGFLEGDRQPVSRETVDRFLCDTGFVGVKVGAFGQVLDLGRTHRLHNAAQRLAISVRDGGCLFLDCPKPPSACEVHHIVEWKNGGRTSVDDGVLLCHHHHMLVHNNHWRIIRRGSEYWLRPPRERDPEQKLILLTSKSPLMRELAHARAGAPRAGAPRG